MVKKPFLKITIKAFQEPDGTNMKMTWNCERDVTSFELLGVLEQAKLQTYNQRIEPKIEEVK